MPGRKKTSRLSSYRQLEGCILSVTGLWLLIVALVGAGFGWLAVTPALIAIPLVMLAWRCFTRPTLEELQIQRHQAGLCEHCGYNLAGITSGRCPECGWLR